MKKLLLTLVVAFACCGSIFAQYESHWPDFYYPTYSDQGALVAGITIDGEIITADNHPDNWNALEVAFFVDGVCRGAGVGIIDYDASLNYLNNEYVEEYGDPFPILNGTPIFYTNSGEVVTVKMYDHVNNIEYEECTITYMGEPYVIYTGVDNDQGWFEPENAIMLNFTSGGAAPQTFTKEIVGYGNGDNYWYFIASPIVEPVIPSTENGFLTTDTIDFFYFDQAQPAAEWRSYDVTNFVVENGKGYLYASKVNTTLIFTGTPNEDSQAEVALTYVEDKPFSGWNLVGNPFAFDATTDRPFTRLDPETGAYLACTEDDVVPMMEGIFVETSGQENDTMLFSYGVSGGGFGGGDKLTINVNKGRGISDRAIIRFDGKASLSKLQLNPNGTQVYFPMDGKDYAVVNAPEMGEMPVNFKAEENGTYSLVFNAQEVSFNYLHLIDNMTGADVNLLENPSYSFEATTSDYASRFKLVFATGNTTDDSFAFFNNGNFIISNEGEAILQVIDVTGRILNSETINGSASVNVNAAPGVYMLRLINGNNVKVQKVIVK